MGHIYVAKKSGTLCLESNDWLFSESSPVFFMTRCFDAYVDFYIAT